MTNSEQGEVILWHSLLFYLISEYVTDTKYFPHLFKGTMKKN